MHATKVDERETGGTKCALKNLFSAEKVAMTTLDENVNRVPQLCTEDEPLAGESFSRLPFSFSAFSSVFRLPFDPDRCFLFFYL